VQPQLKAGNDTEVAPSSADRPKEIGFTLLARLDDLTIGGDHLGR
jgi:hypothetical protein